MNAIWRGLTGRLAPIKAVAKSAQLMALTKKRRLVLATYTGSNNIGLKDALVKAGYSQKRASVTACELMKDPEFIEAIERRKQFHLNQQLGKFERGELTQEQVVNSVRDIDEDLRKIGEVQWAMALRLKCQELLGKHVGAFVEKIELGFGAELAKEIQSARQRVTVIEGTLVEPKKLTEHATN